jgi:heptosyltransferase-2
MQILIIQTAFIGDVILATALIEKWRAYYPEAHIDFLLRKGNEPLLASHPHLREVLVWDKKGGKLKNIFNLLKKIRQVKYDVVINVQRFASSGILTAFSKGKAKVGFSKNPFSSFFNKSFPHEIGDGTHETTRNQQLISEWTDDLPALPRLYPSPTHFEQAQKIIDTIGVGKSYICVAPTSVWFTKQWAEDKWIAFLQQVPAKYHILLLGAGSDTDICERIRQEVGKATITNLAGKASFLVSACLMKNAHMNYVNDSAPLHIASAMNAPTCAIFCSTIPAFGYTPLAENSHIVEVENLACRPCGLHGHKKCPQTHFKCAHDVDIQKLLVLL